MQVKTGRVDGRNGTLKASWDGPYTPDEIDVLAVVDRDADVVYYVRADQLVPGTTNITIRPTPASRETTGFVGCECMTWPYENEGGRLDCGSSNPMKTDRFL